MALNLGQVAGLHIGSSAPLNTNLIWFDNTPGVNLHKVYDFGSSQWVVLDQNIVISITYSNLVTLSQNQLTIGQWFKITDMGNLMALALTSTIVQYTDISGNIVLDDLGNSKQYIVTNNNLTIDNINGLFNINRLNFDFVSSLPDPVGGNQYIFGRDEIAGVPTLIKIEFSKLLSADNNNAISFGSDGGFYLDLTTAVAAIYDIPNGVVSYNTYVSDINTISTALGNMSNAISNITTSLTNYINQQVSDLNIYSKRVPTVNTNIAPSDVITNDTLQTIVNKFQRWINKFKFATGIDIGVNWDDNYNHGWVNNTDTVQSALQKLQYILRYGLNQLLMLPANWQPEDYTQHINALAPLDLYDKAFGKLQGKFDQIGKIENGQIISSNNVTDFELIKGLLSFTGVVDNPGASGFILQSSTSGGEYGNIILRGEDSVFNYDTPRSNNSTGANLRQVIAGLCCIVDNVKKYDKNEIISAFSARLERANIYSTVWSDICNNFVDIADAYFSLLKIDSLVVGKNFYVAATPSEAIYKISDETFIECSNSQPGTILSWSVYLPVSIETNLGRMIFLRVQKNGGNSATVYGNGGYIESIDGSSMSTSQALTPGKLYLFIPLSIQGSYTVRRWFMYEL